MHTVDVATLYRTLCFAANIPDPTAAVVHVGGIDEQKAPLPAGVRDAPEHGYVHTRAQLALESGHGGKRLIGGQEVEGPAVLYQVRAGMGGEGGQRGRAFHDVPAKRRAR